MHAAADLSDDLQALLSDPEMAGLFLGEAHDHLANVEALVLQLQTQPDNHSSIDAAYRSFHTIKGNAGAIGARHVGAVAHGIESLLEPIRARSKELDVSDVDAMLETIDLLHAMVAALERGMREPSSTRIDAGAVLSMADAEPSSESTLIKVDAERLNTLVDLVGECAILQAMIGGNHAELRASGDAQGRHAATLTRMVRELQRLALSLRMVPLTQTFRRAARAARDVCRASGKPIDLQMAGGSTEIDRCIVAQIADPLMHLIRNAIDHGIEGTQARTEAGKPPRGVLSVRAWHQDGQVFLEIADDGRGLDTARIRTHAIARGLVGPDEAPTDADLHQLIFAPGFSTADAVTDVSGRGVGMDVVRRSVDALRGRIDIHTAPGSGTRFLIKLPLTLAMVNGVLVSAGGGHYIVPSYAVRELLGGRDWATHVGPSGTRFVQIGPATYPCVGLADLMGLSSQDDEPAQVLLVIEADERRAAVLVDAVLDTREYVVKPVVALRHPRGINGATVLEDGRVGLILDVAGLFTLLDERRRRTA